jgi:DNA-binding beta-propeller fold protein YncE
MKRTLAGFTLLLIAFALACPAMLRAEGEIINGSVDVGGLPSEMVTTSDGQMLFVSNFNDNTLTLINSVSLDSATPSTETIVVGDGPEEMIMDQSNDYIYVINTIENSIDKVSVSNASVSGTLSLDGTPAGLAMDSLNNYLYVSYSDGSDDFVGKVSLSGFSLDIEDDVKELGSDLKGMAMSPDDDMLAVASCSDRRIYLLDPDTLSNTGGNIQLAVCPEKVIYNDNGNFLAVLSPGDKQLLVITVGDQQVEKTVSFGSEPRDLWYSESRDELYVSAGSEVICYDTKELFSTQYATDGEAFRVSLDGDASAVAVVPVNEALFAANEDTGVASYYIFPQITHPADENGIIDDDAEGVYYVNSSSSIEIPWSSSQDGGYDIGVNLRGDSFTTSVTAGDQVLSSFSGGGLGDTEGVHYLYITLSNEDGVQGFERVSVTLDNTPPSTPTGVSAQAGENSAAVSWSENSDQTDLEGYRVSYGTSPGEYTAQTDVVEGTSCTVSGLSNDVTYYLAVAAVDLAGNESDNSSEVAVSPAQIFGYLDIADSDLDGGCFLATAAWCDSRHPLVKRLISFRDEHLLTFPAGRSFVRIYYRLSPPLAGAISANPAAQSFTRTILLAPLSLTATGALAAGLTFLLCCFLILKNGRPRSWKMQATGTKKD